MLILSIRVDEGILVNTNDGEIRISVLKISKDKVSIGIKAPLNISVNREEIARRDKNIKSKH